MDWDFIIQCILAAGLSAALLALLDARLKLREEKRKTSMFYSISKDLEGDTWKQKDVIEEQSGTIMEQKSTIREQEGTIKVQNNTILEQKHEIESLETDLEESRTMARMLLQRGRENTELTAFTEKLLMLADETANIYYESASSPGNMSRRIRDILHKELADTDILPSINSLIEASYPGFTESLYSEFPWMTQDDRLLVSLRPPARLPDVLRSLPQRRQRHPRHRPQSAQQVEDPSGQTDGPARPPVEVSQGQAVLIPFQSPPEGSQYFRNSINIRRKLDANQELLRKESERIDVK